MPTCSFMTKNGKVSFQTNPKKCHAKHGNSKHGKKKSAPKAEPMSGVTSGRMRKVPSRLMY